MAADPGWPRRKLDDLVPADSPICYGVLKPGPETPGGVPLVRIVDLEDDVVAPLRSLYRISQGLDQVFARSRLVGGEVLVSIQGTVGRVALAPGWLRDANISRTIARVALGGGADSRFLRHWLLSNEGQKTLDDCVLGTTRDSLNIGALRLVAIPAPPLAEQRRIAEILDAADKAIRETKAVIAKLHKERDGIVGTAFEADVREQWPTSTVEVEFDVTAGIALGPHRRPRLNPRKYLRVANVIRDALVLDDVLLMEASDVEAAPRTLREGDLLVVEGHANPNEIGRCARATAAVTGYLFQNHLFRLRSRGRVESEFGVLWLNADYVRRYWRRMCGTSSGLNTINRSMLSALTVCVPPPASQQRVVSIVRAADTRIAAEEAYLTKLMLQKQGLMQDLLTGRVRVAA